MMADPTITAKGKEKKLTSSFPFINLVPWTFFYSSSLNSMVTFFSDFSFFLNNLKPLLGVSLLCLLDDQLHLKTIPTTQNPREIFFSPNQNPLEERSTSHNLLKQFDCTLNKSRI
jgi:hypothetical protein